jgi:hypothetical protein
MKNSVESIVSFSLSSRRPEFTPSLLVTHIDSKNLPGQLDFVITHDSLHFIQPESERTELLSEMSLLQSRVRKFDIQPNIIWPVTSKLTNYRWYVFKDPVGRFYAFLYASRITEKILIKFYEKTKNAVAHGHQNPDRLQKKIEDMVFKFNDYSYKESISEYFKNSNFDVSEVSSKKDTCHTNNGPGLVVRTDMVQKTSEPVKEKTGDQVKIYQREQRLMVVKLAFSFSVAISVLVFILDLFWKLHRHVK